MKQHFSYTWASMNPSPQNFEDLPPGTHPQFLHPQVYEIRSLFLKR
jgi:hypothetical protein